MPSMSSSSRTSVRRRTLFALVPLVMCTGITLAQPGGGGPGARPGGMGGQGGQGRPDGMGGQGGQGRPGGMGGQGGQGGPNNNSDIARCAVDGSDASVQVTAASSNGVDMWDISSSGCPNWDWSGNKTPGYAGVQSYDLQVPQNPIISSSPIMLNEEDNNVKGMVGIAKNGLALFNGLDAENRNAYEYEGQTFDQCGAHAAPMNQYHLHNPSTPTCCLGYVEKAQHSPTIGIMADGIPIFGPRDVNGARPSDLDECGGHIDSEHKFYHYHVPSDSNGNIKFPYLANCLKGCVSTGWPNRMLSSAECVPAETQYDYSTLKIDWDAEVVSNDDIAACATSYTFDVTPRSGGDGTPGNKPSKGSGNGNGKKKGGKKDKNKNKKNKNKKNENA